MKKPLMRFFSYVPEVGVEPTCLSTGDFKSPVYTISPLGQLKCWREFRLPPRVDSYLDDSIKESLSIPLETQAAEFLPREKLHEEVFLEAWAGIADYFGRYFSDSQIRHRKVFQFPTQ